MLFNRKQERNKPFYNVIKNDGPGDLLVWKFLDEDFNEGSQLIVAESEEALFYKDGIIESTFSGGKYSLSTNNYPFISRLRSRFSGNVSSFHCKVYFINKVHKLELLWGTDSPIQVRDPIFNLQTSIQARGSYSVQVSNSKKFLLKLIGNNIQSFNQEELNSYFRSAFLQYIKDAVAREIKNTNKEILEISTEKEAIAESLKSKLNEVLDEYGVRLVNFYINAIDIPENDPNRGKLEEAFANKNVMSILGNDWERQQSIDILKGVANNPGDMSSAGAGIGMGMAAGSAFSNMMNQFANSTSSTQNTQQKKIMCPHCNSPVNQGAKFCNECGENVKPRMENCSQCNSSVPVGAKFCNECGNKLIPSMTKCSNCSAELSENDKFCNECGQKQSGDK